jgi:hypothetical protein
MNRSLTNSFVQIGLLLAAFAVGTLLSLSVPSPYQALADEADEVAQPAAASLDHAAILESFDQANEMIGIEVDARRLDYVCHIG